jgi:anti-sigma regulatory factor (Ser/Thr protein kinase)
MCYYRCPDCGVTVYGAGTRFTRSLCPHCAAPLSSTDRIYDRERYAAAITRRFAAEPSAAPAARRALETLLWNLEDAEYELAALLMTELITNSIEHSRTGPGGAVRLDVSLTESLIRIRVGDEGPGFVPAARTAASPLDSHWGLHLVDELADRWDADARPTTSVWFELDRVPSAAAPDACTTDALVAVQGGPDV